MHISQTQTKKPFFRHPLVWTILITTSLAAGLISYYYFSTALPFVDITITMNKSQALTKAREIAASYNIGPQDSKESAYFNSDNTTQNYIELERGGAEAWKKFLAKKEYYPYSWLVRRFKQGETNEAYFIFTPEGKPYGFVETIAESAPGAALSGEDARARAQNFITTKWNIDLSQYKQKDSRKEVRSNGRIDHTFIYEKQIEILNDPQTQESTPNSGAHYLLTIVVTGDKVTTVNHTVDVPESFTRSFEHIRSFNDTLHSFAMIIAYLLYLIIFCLFGILYLLKINYLLPRQAVIAGIGLAAIQFIAELNQLPTLWFSYDTALSSYTFLLQTFLGMLISFMWLSALYCTTFIAAEGLTRLAFGGHIQLWSAWKVNAASSTTMLGKTIGSYCIVAFDIAFIVLFYGVLMHYWGWWSPSAALTDPNILSTYVPAYGVLARSLAAGFWEESLFRAVPIATCALIGKRLGSRNWGIVAGFILQALIFGAAHASYPQIPSYVRVVELFIPSLAFAAIYLLFGLIPGIIAHAVYDAILMSLPLFVSDASGMWFQRSLVILGCALPLIIIVISRLRTKSWIELPDAFYNGAWQPTTQLLPFEKTDITKITGSSQPFSVKKIMTLLGLALFGCAVWIYCVPFKNVSPSLSISSSKAVEVAQSALTKQSTLLDSSWRILPSVYSPEDDTDTHAQHIFIWQKFGKTAYNQLLGSYLTPPQWNVRYARFDGDMQKRAEEYKVLIDGNGVVSRIKHTLPQSAALPSIDEQTARTQALNFIAQKYQLKAEDIQEVTSQSDALPNRLDWYFSFTQPNITFETVDCVGAVCKTILNTGVPRINVAIAGNTLVDGNKSVQIPEEWSRLKKMHKALTDSMATIRWIGWFLLVLLSSLYAALLFKRGQLKLKVVFISACLYAALSLTALFANMPQIIASLSTAKPVLLQVATYLALESTKILLESFIIGIFAGVIFSIHVISALTQLQKIGAGVSGGILLSGSFAFIRAYIYPTQPWFPSFEGASAYIPFIVFLKYFLANYVRQTLYMTVLAFVASTVSGWYRLIPLFIAVLFMTPHESATSGEQWLVAIALTCIVFAFLYAFIIKANPRIVPFVIAIPFILELSKEAYAQAFPGSLGASILTMVCILALAYWIVVDKKKR